MAASEQAFRFFECLRMAGRRRGVGRQPTFDLHLRLFRYLESIVDLDAQISHGTLEFRMTEQQLHYSQVLGPSIDQRRFGAAPISAEI